jgi:DNA mismatch repair protein MutS2
MINGKAVGTLENIEKNKATVNYGVFLSKVSLDELELVEAMKNRRRCSDCSSQFQFSVNRF